MALKGKGEGEGKLLWSSSSRPFPSYPVSSFHLSRLRFLLGHRQGRVAGLPSERLHLSLSGAGLSFQEGEAWSEQVSEKGSVTG